MNIHEVKTHWAAVVALGEATLSLQRAKDLFQLAGHSPQAVASVDVLAMAANGLLREAGQALVALRTSEDAEVRRFAELLLDRLHGVGWREAVTTPDAEVEE